MPLFSIEAWLLHGSLMSVGSSFTHFFAEGHMAGSRPSTFKTGGGGFLNNVDGTITNYHFTDDPLPGTEVPKKGDFRVLWCQLSIRLDGSETDISHRLFVGSADDWEISEDGKTLSELRDGVGLGNKTAFALFVSSLVAKGFPEARLPEDTVNFEAIIGTRVRFIQIPDERMAEQKKKRIDKRTGREYNYTNTVVDRVYTLPPTPKQAVLPADPSSNGVLLSLTQETLLTILADKNGKVERKQLDMEALKRLMHHPDRDQVRELIKSEAFLAKEDGWTYERDAQLVRFSF